ncbi:ATP synthase subunit epsilon, mitochondrial [Electrophorus electricus]|nr:ATP synthase subunit epsilon, mitochondrial [Electrophorus electricus]
MVSYWRQAGLSYIRYSAICARVVRAALKPQLKTEAVKNAEASVKVTKLKTVS